MELTNQAKKLWKTVFNDAEAFIEDYFNCFCKQNSLNYLTVKDNEKQLASMLLACNYDYFYNGNILPFAYLTGVCTQPNLCNKGYNSLLIHDTLNKLYQKKYAICGLITAKENLITYYQKFDFTLCETVLKKQNIIVAKDSNILSKQFSLLCNIDITETKYLHFFTFKEYQIHHNIDTLKLYNDNYYSRFALSYNDKIYAILIGIEMPNYINIIYIDAIDTTSKNIILAMIFNKYHKEFKLSVPKNQMIRIINAKKVLEIFDQHNYKDNLLQKNEIQIVDNIIKQNNIIFRSKYLNTTKQSTKNNRIVIDIKELSRLIFYKSKLFMMLDK